MKARRFLYSHSWVDLTFWVGTGFCWKNHAWPLKSVILRCFTTPSSMSCWYTWTSVSPISCKNDVSSHGTPPTKPWRKKGDDLPAPSEHFPSPHGTLEYKSLCSGGCTARILKFFLSSDRLFLCPFSACHWRRGCALVHWITFKAAVRMYPFEMWCTAMCWSSLMRCNIDWIDMFSSRDLIFCFQTGFWWIHSCTLIGAWALMLFGSSLLFCFPALNFSVGSCPTVDRTFQQGWKSVSSNCSCQHCNNEVV